MKTALSVGLAINEILIADEAVRGITHDVFPGYADTADLPYISYRRKGLDPTAVKNGPTAQAAIVEVMCFAKLYGQSVELAEAVNAVLDGWSGDAAGLHVRGINLINAYEEDAGDAKSQVLEYKIRI